MHSLDSSFPTRAEGAALHARLCRNDPVAPAEVLAAYLPPLIHWLARRFREDEHRIVTAAQDALCAYLQCPQRYHPARSDLGVYLRLASRRDLLNERRREARHHRRRIPWNPVELPQVLGNHPADELLHREERDLALAFLETSLAGMSAEERAVFALMRDGERAVGPFARVLGLEDRPMAEQRRLVQRVKDRIMHRLRRGRRAS